MIAMHYLINLKTADDVQAVRRRAAERGPLFDGLPGLAHKWFLVDPDKPAYATFYLWNDPAAALAFLEGPFFHALCETFGRPDVLLLLPASIRLPEGPVSVAALGDFGDLPYDMAVIRTLDPRFGGRIDLAFGEPRSGRRFEIAYHASGNA
jgi:Domain of unknown function (DUF4865)